MKSVFATIITCSLVCFHNFSFAQSVTSISRISQNSAGVGQDNGVLVPVISANGKFITFPSTGTNLVENDTNGKSDIFAKNLSTGNFGRVNLGPQNAEGNDGSFAPSISARGPNGLLAVVFATDASNLGQNRVQFPDTNNKRDIYFTLPRKGNLTRRISVGPGAIEADDDSGDASVAITSAPGNILVAYRSLATNLVSNDTNNKRDIFLATISKPDDGTRFDPGIDIQTIRVSVGPNGIEGDDDSVAPQISGDGRFIVFESTATNLVAGVTPSSRQIYLYNIEDRTVSLISKASDGTPGNAGSRSASVSFGGGFVVYFSNATNIVGDGLVVDQNTPQIFLFNTRTGATTRINTSTAGTPGNGSPNPNNAAVVSPNGRFVLFSDNADNLVSNDTNGKADIFFKDLSNQSIIRVSSGLNGAESDGVSLFPSLGLNGFTSLTAFAAFASDSTNLVQNDTEGNSDIFLATITASPPPLTANTILEVPPDVATEEKKITVTMESFTTDTQPQTLRNAITQAATKKTRVAYEVRTYRETSSGKRRDRQTKTTRRTTVSFSKLKPGNYNVYYRAKLTRGKRVVAKTNFSAKERVEVGGEATSDASST